MATKTSTPKTLATLGFALTILGVGGLYMYTAPQLQASRVEQQQLENTLTTRTTELRTLLEARTNLQTAKQSLTQAGVNIDRLDAIVPATEDMPTVYYQLQDYTKSIGGLTSYDFQVGQPLLSAAGLAEVPVTIVVAGGYTEVKRFIGQIQTSERPFVVSNLSLVLTEGSYRATIVGYYLGGTLSPSFNGASK